MIKILLLFIVLICSAGLSKNYGQNATSQGSKFEYLKYEFSFSSSDFQEVLTMETFITNITKAKDVYFDNVNNKVIVTTDYKLELNIIKGKFAKQDIELLTFVKL